MSNDSRFVCCIHEYPAVSSDSMTALSAFLDHPALLDLLQRQSKTDCTPLHLAVLSIFAVHNCGSSTSGSGSADAGGRSGEGTGGAAAASLLGSQGAAGFGVAGGARSHGDAAQRGLYRSRALTVLFRTARLMCQAARTAAVAAQSATATAAAAVAASNGATNGSGDAAAAAAAAAARPVKTGVSCLLVAMNVLLQWLAAQPSFAAIHLQHATEDEVAARGKFWVAASQLLQAVAAAYPAGPASDAAPTGARRLQQPNDKKQQQQQSGSAGGGSDDAGALPEELELLGFEPLRSKHHWHVTDVGKLAVDESVTRTRRMLAAAQLIASSLIAASQGHQQLLNIEQQRHASAEGKGASLAVSSPVGQGNARKPQQWQQSTPGAAAVAMNGGRGSSSAATEKMAARAEVGIPASASTGSAVVQQSAGAGSAATGLLHGQAATALDLQQAQAASDALLARLAGRQAPAAVTGTAQAAVGNGLVVGLQPAPGYDHAMSGQQGALGRSIPLAAGQEQQHQLMAGVASRMMAQPAPSSLFGGPLGTSAAAGSGLLVAQQQEHQLPGAATGHVGAGGLGHTAAEGLLGLARPAAADFVLLPGSIQPLASAHIGSIGVPGDSMLSAQLPNDIAWQQLGAEGQGDAAEGAGHTAASYQLEQTARAAADRILSPEMEEGPTLLQEHYLQRQQQLYNVGGIAIPSAVGGAIAQGSGRPGQQQQRSGLSRVSAPPTLLAALANDAAAEPGGPGGPAGVTVGPGLSDFGALAASSILQSSGASGLQGLQDSRVLLGLAGGPPAAAGGQPGGSSLMFHAAGPGVLLPPVDVVQSQNPFA
eukprot:gene4156-4404_t